MCAVGLRGRKCCFSTLKLGGGGWGYSMSRKAGTAIKRHRDDTFSTNRNRHPTLQARVMVAQSDRGNSKCQIQSAPSLQPGAAPSSQLRRCSTAETKVPNMECRPKKKKKKCERRGAGKGEGKGGQTVSDPAVSASGTRYAVTQAVLSDGRAATAVFRNTSRPVYCLGAWVSAPKSPPPLPLHPLWVG